MGTRAVVHFGETHIATHWDGYPGGLGETLKGILPSPTLDDVIQACSEHSIDFATPEVREKTEMERFEKIAEKANANPKRQQDYTAEGLKKMYDEEGKELMFGVHASSDSPISSWKNYGDWPEYEYIVKADVVLVRDLYGTKHYGRGDENIKPDLDPEYLSTFVPVDEYKDEE